MSDARWQRLQALFEALLDRAPDEREAWLASVEPDPELRREALALADADRGPRISITRQVREASARIVEASTVERLLGLKREEIAEVLSLSVPTIDRELRFARAWLKQRLAA